MKVPNVIAMDAHCEFCEVVATSPKGRVLTRRSVGTSIEELTEVVQSIRRPRMLVFEESPLADWLYRNLKPYVDELIVCDPRRNHLIARDGDKDDPIDADKLAELARGGHLRKVHHPDSESRAIFKRHVGLYHDQVSERVRRALHVIWYLRRYGVVVKENALADLGQRSEVLTRLPSRRVVRQHVRLLVESYDLQAEHEQLMHRELVRLAGRIEVIRRFVALPGIKWVRASTFYAYVDTPWRFRSKQALWKYMGIGLERRRSGKGKSLNRLGVPVRYNRPLKYAILGAAKSAVAAGNNPFADQHERWLHDGRSPHIARRNVARSLSGVMWGMWKNQADYRSEWVGRSTSELAARA